MTTSSFGFQEFQRSAPGQSLGVQFVLPLQLRDGFLIP
jgi:hypothetical protein